MFPAEKAMPEATRPRSCTKCGENNDVVTTFLAPLVNYSRCGSCGATWITSTVESDERVWDVSIPEPGSSTAVLSVQR